MLPAKKIHTRVTLRVAQKVNQSTETSMSRCLWHTFDIKKPRWWWSKTSCWDFGTGSPETGGECNGCYLSFIYSLCCRLLQFLLSSLIKEHRSWSLCLSGWLAPGHIVIVFLFLSFSSFSSLPGWSILWAPVIGPRTWPDYPPAVAHWPSFPATT